MDKFDVDTSALRQFVEDLKRYEQHAIHYNSAVDAANHAVSDASWGVVGAFVLPKYRRTLHTFEQYLDEAVAFLGGIDDRIGRAAEVYDTLDAEAKARLDALNKEMEQISRAATVKDARNVHVPEHGHGVFVLPKKVPGPGEGIHGAQETVAAFKGVEGSDDEVPAIIAASAFTAVEATEFVLECKHAIKDIGYNPLKFLIEVGLGFLIEIFYPLQWLIHQVSGDPHALEEGAEQFREIGEGLHELSEDFVSVADQRLIGWLGEAATAGRKRLAEASDGFDGLAARSGELARILFMSSIVMDIIEDLLKSILTELVMWALKVILPQYLAGPFTFGASAATATATAVVKTADTVQEATSWIDKVIHVLEKIEDILEKLAFNLVKGAFKALGENVTKYHSRSGHAMSNEQLGSAFDQPRGSADFERTVDRERTEAAGNLGG